MTVYSDLAKRLRGRGAKTVALQFPAGLKRRAGEVAQSLKEQGFEVIVSGDPCYGACDLAMEALVYADVLVHFGHTPLKDPDPRVLFEPYRVDFDPVVLNNVIPCLKTTRVGLVTTAQHLHLLDAMKAELAASGVEALTTKGSRGCEEGQVLGCSFAAARIPGAEEVIFVGTGVFHPLGVQLATGLRVVALDPFTGGVQEVNAEKFLRRRHALIEKARSAGRIGLLVSTKTGQERYEMARVMAARCERAILVLMREISPDELTNLGFPAYVNFACPRLAYDDQVRFPAPVLTPQEFSILLGERSFQDYLIDELT
ncbi:MAG: 2-(3-amino-3-carboxypropyl)histidine synthase [Methanoregulaceae archaeon PtaB.Bin056]|nr:MAG: 2-(3-amino-3-carboxypropyl)histidine synthase [Methanoregulaceae archaeon PtaB.Bin056]